MAARFTWPSFSRSARVPDSDSSQAGTAASAGEPGEDLGQLEARGRELLHDAFAAHARFLRDEPRLLHRGARAVDARLGIEALLIERAQRSVGIFERAAFGRSSAFDFQAAREEILELAFELDDGQIAVGQRRLQLLAARLSLRALVGHALQADAHRAFARTARFDADQQIAAGELRGLRAGTRATARPRDGLRARLRDRHARESSASSADQAAIELGAGARQRVLGQARFARDFGRLLFEALAAHGGFLRAGALAFELAEQVRMVAMRALDAALRLVALAFRRRRVSSRQVARCVSHVAGIVFAGGELRAQRLDAMLALEHAGVRIAAAVDAQPVAPEPFAGARDDRFVMREIAAHGQRVGQRFRAGARATAGARWRRGR